MSFNIVDLIKDQVAEQVTGYIGNMLGGDTNQAKKAFDGALPAILSGLGNTASTTNGAGALFDTVSKQDDGILDNLGDLLGGDTSSLVDMGTSALGSLLGGSGQGGLGSIVDAVSGYAGTDSGTSKTIMGLIAPLVFSVIKRKFMGGDSSFNVGSLVDMFTGQKDNIAAAVPKGLNLNFDNTIVDNVSQSVQDTVHETVNEGKSSLGKLIPLALLLGAGWLAYNMFTNKETTTVPTQTTQNDTAQQVDVARLGQNVEGTMKNMMSTLGGIKDVASAEAAIPALTEATTNFGNYAGMLDKIPAGAREQITQYVMDYMPQLEKVLGQVGAIPGVGVIVKPVIEALSAKLALFQ
ncbi:MAG: DUF937 domain-containing protein [Sulfurovum sp.]|nr:DUF937 domain-containing protein [Sulfurovum sp.]